MKTFSVAASGALERGDAIVSAASAVYCTPPVFLWGGQGQWPLAGDTGTETYEGIGDRAMIVASSGVLGGSAQNVVQTLSGVEPAALEVLDATGVKGASAVIRRLIFDSSGTMLLGAYVFARGRIDELNTPETIGGAAAIQVTIEGAARGLGRRGGRLRSDADQRLINSSDNMFRYVSFAADKTLYWGGKRPSTAGGALSSGGSGSGIRIGGGTGGVNFNSR